MTIVGFLVAVLIGVSCRLLQPDQPASAIATVLLIIAVGLLAWPWGDEQ